MIINVSSPAFRQGETIPTKYTADGDNVSPPLEWSGVPLGTKCLALVCDDPDAPKGTWVHWLLYGIPPDRTSLNEGVPRDPSVEGLGAQGTTDFRRTGYGGPARPHGKPHRYFFRLFALDQRPSLKPGAKRPELEEAMKGHVLAQGQLMARYQR
jgi:Raf kinase inhibitor-like YbhB/YbcL family protein